MTDLRNTQTGKQTVFGTSVPDLHESLSGKQVDFTTHTEIRGTMYGKQVIWRMGVRPPQRVRPQVIGYGRG